MKPVNKMSQDELLGRIAYNAYCLTSEGKSLISGATLPLWSELKIEIQKAWIQSAKAVITYVRT